MARITPIRISGNDKSEYARLVRNARAKIARTKKNHGVDLTSEVDLPTLESFSTRKHFNEWKENVSSFTNRHNLNYQFVTNDYGITLNKKGINAITRRRRIEQSRAKKELDKVKDIQISQGGVPFATVEQRTTHFSVPDVTGISIPKDFDFNKVRSKERLEDIIEVGKKRVDPDYYDKRKKQMQDNFIVALEGSFDSEADELVERIKKVHPDEFYELYLSIEEFDFDVFDSEGITVIARESQIDKMMLYLNDYEGGKRNNDLEPF